MFGWFFGKNGVKELKIETKRGFDEVKKDFSRVGNWIKHLDSEKKHQKEDIKLLKEEISSLKNNIEEIKNVLSFIGEMKISGKNQTPKQVSKQQTPVQVVQAGVQAGVQAPKLEQFSLTERAILWVLINNSGMKLSYEDIGRLLGKEKSTIRSQISIIKQKSESLIEEIIEKNGKKRVFIPEEIKEKILKKAKVRVKDKKEPKKT